MGLLDAINVKTERLLSGGKISKELLIKARKRAISALWEAEGDWKLYLETIAPEMAAGRNRHKTSLDAYGSAANT